MVARWPFPCGQGMFQWEYFIDFDQTRGVAMSRHLLLAGFAVLCVGGLACAGGSTGGADPKTYRKDLPQATATDLVRMSQKILARNVYRIDRVEEETYVLIETAWTGRYPLEDEIEVGVVEVMTRIVIRGRPRQRSNPGTTTNLQVSTLEAENRAMLGDSADWVPFMTPMFKEYMDEIVRDLTTELNTGVRVF